MATSAHRLAIVLRPLNKFTLGALFRRFWRRIGATWAILLVETGLFALIPLLVGRSIDGLLASDPKQLFQLAALLVALVAVAVARRVYDTRAYGEIRVALGAQLSRRFPHLPVSAQTARQDMARELVDFLEIQTPELLTALVQIIVALALLWLFHPVLAASALVAGALMIGVYAAFHRRFFQLNADLNQQKERQVTILTAGGGLGFMRHLRALRRHEVRLSDTEAIVYGLIYLCLLGFILFNLWFSTQIASPSAGGIFTIVTYSTTFLEASIALPMALQTLTRLSEISRRINSGAAES